MHKRKRLTPEVRAKQIVDAAAALLLNQGILPLSPERLRKVTGVSKALIYAYFPTQYDLLNALLRREFETLIAAGMTKAVEKKPLREAALSCALIYFEHVADVGPLAHLILREHYMTGNVDEQNRNVRNRIILPLARAARRELLLAAKENIAAINLAITIPEEAGRLVYVGELERGVARKLCLRLISSSISALAPTKR